MGNQTWGIQVPSPKGFVSLGGLRDQTVLSGTVTVDLSSTVSGTKVVNVRMNKFGSKALPLFESSGKSGSRITVDTTKFPDGVYEIQAVADTTGGEVTSQPRTIYLLNGSHQGSVSLVNVNEGEVITDSKEIELKTSGTPVPFTSISFKAVNLKTGEENIRSTYTVLPEMKMLWRAQYLENGDYLVKLEAKVGDKVTVDSKAYQVKVSH